MNTTTIKLTYLSIFQFSGMSNCQTFKETHNKRKEKKHFNLVKLSEKENTLW